MKGGTSNPRKLIDILIYIFFAVAVLPIIGGQVVALEGDTTNFSASEIVLMGLITTLIVLGVVYAIVKTIL